MNNKNLIIFNLSLKISVIATAIWSGTLAVLLSDIINSYSLQGTQVGLMSSMISFGALAALVASIMYQSKFKKTQIIIFCGFLTSLMLITKGIPMLFVMFLGVCFAMGFGHGATDSYQSSFLADLNQGNISKHMGIMHGIFGIGAMITPIILHKLLKYYEWRTIYHIVGVVCILLIAQFAVVTRYMKSRVSVAGKIEPRLTMAIIKEFFKSKQNIFLFFCIFFGAAAQSGIIIWVIRYVTVSLNSPEIAVICLSAYWITSTISRFITPLLSFKTSQILAFGAFCAALIWTIAMIINLPLVICVASGIVGLVSGSCIPMSLSEGAAINPDKTGYSTSILMFFKTLAQMLAPIIVAFIMTIGSMSIGMYSASIFFVMNGVFAALMTRKNS